MVPRKSSPKAITEAVEDKPIDYELVMIINPEVGDESLDATIDKVSQFITEKSGIISNVERWGKRKLAYPIKHFIEGHYILTQFKSKPGLNRELEANLRISEEILRHLLIKIES